MASRQLAIDVAIEDGKIYDKLGYLGGVGIFYLGLRAAGILMGIGPDLNSNETSLPDFFGFISTYVGGVCWLSGKINEVEERGCKKDYKNYLEKMGNSTLETK